MVNYLNGQYQHRKTLCASQPSLSSCKHDLIVQSSFILGALLARDKTLSLIKLCVPNHRKTGTVDIVQEEQQHINCLRQNTSKTYLQRS